MKKQRIVWIDNFKAVALFWVVLGHTPGIPGFLQNYIKSFHLAMFFFVSGILYGVKYSPETSFPNFILKKIRTIILPYFVFGFFTYVFWVVFTRTIGGHSHLAISPFKPLIGMLYGVGDEYYLAHNIPLWFLPCLFCMQIMFYWMARLSKRVVLMSVILLTGILGHFVLEYRPFPLPWGLEYAMRFLPYYGGGFLLSKYPIELKLNNTSVKNLLLLAGVCAIQQLIIQYLPASSISVYYLNGFTGILFWLFACLLLPSIPLLTIIGIESITIFALHDLTFSIFTGIAVFGLGLSSSFKDNSFILSLIYAGGAMLVLIPVARILKRYIPWVVGDRR